MPSFTKCVYIGTSTVTGNIVPSSDSATDIGTNSVRFFKMLMLIPIMVTVQT